MAYEIIQVSGQAKDITGETFSKLTAIAPVGRNKKGAIEWLCICNCGTERVTTASLLITNQTTSCGCASAIQPSHNMTNSSEYRTYHTMKGRCLRKTNKRYKNYGGRGITICDRWLSSFENFYADMGKRPSPKHSIDRIDNDGNYEPSNCRWTTNKVQANNRRQRRDARLIEHNGVSHTLAEWSRITGFSSACILNRLKTGWPVGEALSRKPNLANRTLRNQATNSRQ